MRAEKRTSKNGSARKSAKHKSTLDYILPPLYLAVWTASSSGLIVLNKHLLVDDGFDFPLALTGAGQTVSFFMGQFPAFSSCWTYVAQKKRYVLRVCVRLVSWECLP